MRIEPTITAEIILKPEGGQVALIFDFYQEPYVKAQIGDIVGYFSTSCLVAGEIVNKIRYGHDPELLDLIEKYGIKSPEVRYRGDSRKIRLVKKYGQRHGLRISNKEIWIGMSEEMLLDSWGRPSNKNITQSAFGKSEQWIYNRGQFRSDYVYLNDGIVSTIQYSE